MRAETWPIGGLPEGTEYRVWLRAASLAGSTVRELLQDTLTVQGVAYQRALEDLALDVARAVAEPHKLSFEDVRRNLAHAGAGPRGWLTEANVPTDPDRWKLHVTAEEMLTEALRLLQDNDVHECMRRLLQAQQQVFEVTILDKAEQGKEGQL